MEKWYSAQDLAGLTGVPKTVSGVVRKAKRDNWLAKHKDSQGGGFDYHWNSLPEATQDALFCNSNELAPMKGCTDLVKTEDSKVDITQLKKWQQDIFTARLALYREFERLKDLYGYNRAVKKIVSFAKTETLPEHLQKLVPQANARKGKHRTLSDSMVKSWHRQVQRYGIGGLAPKPARKSSVPPWATYFIKCYAQPQKPSITQAMETMEKVLPDTIPMPSYHQVYRFHAKRSRIDRERGRRTGSELKALKGYRKRDVSKLLPMQVGICDGHSYKSKVAHPIHGNPFKPEICSVVDAATKVLMGWSVGLAESALTVSGAIRHAATVNKEKPNGGVFALLYTDGGSGNKAKINTDEFAGILPRIGTTPKFGMPGNAQGHGIIEIINKTLWVRSAKELPTYVGKDMDSLVKRDMYLLVNREIKQNGVSQHLPTWPQFLAHCQQSVDAYNRRPNSSLPRITDPETGRRRYMAPLEMWVHHIQHGWDPKKCQLSENELEILFLPRLERTVQRSGVQIFTNYYYNKVLEHYDGQKVQVGFDIHNGEKVQIWDAEGRLICWAIFEKNRDSFFPMSEVEMAMNKRAKQRAKIKYDDLEKIEAERRGTIDIVAQKADVIDIKAASPTITVDKKALQQEMAAQATSVQIPEDDKGKYVLWNALDARMDDDEVLADEERLFYEAYVNSASYKAFKSVAENLGQQQAQ